MSGTTDWFEFGDLDGYSVKTTVTVDLFGLFGRDRSPVHERVLHEMYRSLQKVWDVNKTQDPEERKLREQKKKQLNVAKDFILGKKQR